MVRKINDYFILDTEYTTYCFRVMSSGHLEHLYYGRKLFLPDAKSMETLVEKQVFVSGSVNYYDEEHKIKKEKEMFEDLPGSYSENGEVEGLCITLKDKQYDLIMEIFYYVYPECDVITRSARFINSSSEKVNLKRLMSMQLDLDTPDYVFTTFTGTWAREMKRTDMRVISGKHINSAYAGGSSNRANPFVMLSRVGTTEDFGECFGFNLVYSGNHYEAVEVSSCGKTRFVSGINPQSFDFPLEPGEIFEAPEAVMSYSCQGFNGKRSKNRGIKYQAK